MAKCGSLSSTQPLQGMLLILVLVLAASLDAGGVCMAWEEIDLFEHTVSALEKLGPKAIGKLKGAEKYKDALKGAKTGFKVHKYALKLYDLVTQNAPAVDVVDTVAVAGRAPLPVFWVDIFSTAAASTGSCAAAGVGVPGQPQASMTLLGRKGSTVVENLPSATFVNCPGGGAIAFAVLGLGRGGDLASRFPTFSYLVLLGPGAYTSSLAWFGPASQAQWGRRVSTPLFLNPYNPSLYYVGITGIRVDGKIVSVMPPVGRFGNAYLSTADNVTALERRTYGALKAALVQSLQMNYNAATGRGVVVAPVPPPPNHHPDQLCYRRADVAGVPFPSVAVEFTGGAVMTFPGIANLFLSDGQYDCLHIVPTRNPGQMSVLGSVLQSSRPMTIQLAAAAGGGGTLTF